MSRETKALLIILAYCFAAFAWGVFMGYKLAQIP